MSADIYPPSAADSCFDGCHFICNPDIPEEAAPFFRKRFALDSPAKKAVVHLCGLGYHELYVNRTKADGSLLTPPQTLYDKSAYYRAYDITGLLVPGDNVLAVLLGNGLYNCFDGMAWYFDTAPWRDRPKLMLRCSIETESGKSIVLRSGRDFETGQSRILYNMLFGGETADFTAPAAEDAPAITPALTKSPGGLLKPFTGPSVTESDPLPPAAVIRLSDHKWLYDFGINRAGWVHVSAAAPCPARLVLRYGEQLKDDGSLDTSNIDLYTQKGRFQTDEYILDEHHSITDARPHFTYHGFRYVEACVEEGELSSLSLTAYAVHSKADRIGGFSCSDETVNRIFSMAETATLSNLVNVPTDCPQREKNGWTGDASLSAEQMCLQFDVSGLFTRWLRDLRDAQRPSGQLPGIVPSHWFGYNWGSGPVWDSALFELPYEIYRCQNDPAPLKENYGAMKKYLSFLETMAEDSIVSFGLGDWCAPFADTKGIACPTAVTDTAYYYYMVNIAACTAGLLGLIDERSDYLALAERIRNAFYERLYDPGTGEVLGHCQTAQGAAVYFGLLKGEDAALAAKRLAEMVIENGGRLDYGIIGSKTVPETLSRYGCGQLACDMLLYDGFPSYRHWADMGCTALPERWDMTASLNHHMFSDVCRFYMRRVAGLGLPDFKKKAVTFTPDFPQPLSWAEAWTDTPEGKFACRWAREGDGIRFCCFAPEGYRLSLKLPPGYSGAECGAGNFLILSRSPL